ncbi:MAG TPA: DUF1801 domain-containing protein [Phycisphaerales bacterium]|nr:DUF1801 domain-containing protein [Phycisphaerales bacterium]
MAKKASRDGRSTSTGSGPARTATVSKRRANTAKTRKPKLLSGGNPQIAKGDGDGPVQAYIAAMPGWKRDVGRRLDAMIERIVPGVKKAVRWNSPFYGVEGQGWFIGVHCITKYIKVAFFSGASLEPQPPVDSKHKDVRYFHIYEGDRVETPQLEDWVRQAAARPGTDCF